jgi:hypothetical protein
VTIAMPPAGEYFGETGTFLFSGSRHRELSFPGGRIMAHRDTDNAISFNSLHEGPVIGFPHQGHWPQLVFAKTQDFTTESPMTYCVPGKAHPGMLRSLCRISSLPLEGFHILCRIEPTSFPPLQIKTPGNLQLQPASLETKGAEQVQARRR